MEGDPQGRRLTRRLHFEELEPGLSFGSPTVRVEEADIHAFARRFDPQPFHLDAGEAAGTIFRGLCASGWHTAALTMRLLTQGEVVPVGGIIGVGLEEMRWPTPVRPGDTLTVDSEILRRRDSRTYPDRGFVTWKATTRNQDGAIVQVMVANLIVPRLHPAIG